MIENLSYRFPRVMLLCVLVIFVSGLSAFLTIGRQEDPTITNIFAMVRTPFPGADPVQVEELLTIPLEERLRQIPEIDLIDSTSSQDISIISLELSPQVPAEDIEGIWAEVRDELEEAELSFPAGALASELDTNLAATFSAIVAVSALHDHVPTAIIGRYADDLAGDLREVWGTQYVRLFGQPEEEIRLEVDPGRLSSLGLSLGDVADMIRAAQSQGRAGQVENGRATLQLDIEDDLASVDALRDALLAIPGRGDGLRVGTLFDLYRGVKSPSTIGLHNGRDTVFIAVQPQVDLRTDRWLERVRAVVEEHSSTAPNGLALEVIFDQSHYTNERLAEVGWNLMIGFVLIAVMLKLVMGSAAALVVAATVPLVGLATIACMKLLGVPLHQMSITGIIVALGLVVDANIVMVDQIKRLLDRGTPAARAVGQAVRRLVAPLFASTATTAIAFTPMLLLPGPSGDFISTIAVSVILMLIWSCIVAFIITPGLAGHLLRPAFDREDERESPRQGAFARVLHLSLRHPKSALIVFLAIPVSGFLMAPTLPEQFFPGVDRDQFQLELHMPPGVSIQQTRQAAIALEQKLMEEPEVTDVTWMVGRGVPVFYYNVLSQEGSTPHYAQAMVMTQSPAATEAVISRVQTTLGAEIPAAQVVVRKLVQGPAVTAPIEIRLFGKDLAVLREVGEELRSVMVETPGIIGTRASLAGGTPRLTVDVDQARAAALGLNRATIAEQISDAVNGRTAILIRENEEQIPVRVMLPRDARSSLERLPDLYIIPPNAAGGADGPVGVPLSSFASLALEQQTSSLMRRNGDRVNIVQAFTEADVLPQVIEQDLLERLQQTGFEVPAAVALEMGGDSDARAQTMQDLQEYVPVLVVIAIAIVVSTFNSFRLAAIAGIVCLLSVGSSLFSLALFTMPIGIMASIGLIGAIGVSINAAIIVTTALQADHRAIEQDADTIVRLVIQSSRHIVSTTVTTFAGFLPLIWAGGEFWPPFAVAIAGGVLLSTMVSLIVVPILFQTLWASKKRAWQRRIVTLSTDG